jgi:hypothetical protein
LYEAFDNTHKWARQSFTGKTFNPSVRGIYGRVYKIEMKNIPTYTNSEGLVKYFKEISLRNPAAYRYLTFLEISIFDSGSGLAQRYSGNSIDSMNLQEEYSFLIDCLKKHNTSHKEVGIAINRGVGLFQIMELLGRKLGYLRIRSGRMSLYRNFLSTPFYTSLNGPPNYSLLDIETNSTIPSTRAYADGTLITIIIPQIKVD